MRTTAPARPARTNRAAIVLGIALLTLSSRATAQVASPAASDVPDRTTPYNNAPLALAADTVVTRDVSYSDTEGADATLRALDIYAPRGAKGLPVVIYIHGGGWSRGDKREVGSQPKMFNENRTILVSVNYRLAPEIKYPTNINDIGQGIAWVQAHIAEYGGDPKKLVVMGHSAGSHLASLIATHPAPLGKQGIKVSDLKGAISLDGSGFNLVERLAGGDAKVSAAYKRTFGGEPSVYADASPIQHINDGAKTPPFLLTFVQDGNVNHTQAKAFADRIIAQGGRAELKFIEGKDHATLASDLGTERDTAGSEILDFVRSVTQN